jgi:type VI secretion system protein ImpH
VTQDRAFDELIEQPWRFEFAQALRLLLRHSAHGSTGLPADRRFDVDREPVRIGAHQSLGFPASDIQELTELLSAGKRNLLVGSPLRNRPYETSLPTAKRRSTGESDPDPGAAQPAPEAPAVDIQALRQPPSPDKRKMLINFLGLTGPSGVLPQYYTQFLKERSDEKDEGPAEFLDIFNHRMAMLFYYAWEKYRFPVTYERRPEHDFFRQILFSLVGLGTEHLRGRNHLRDDFFAEYAALLAVQPRSASALRGILSDFFKVPVEVEQFAGTWYPLDDDSITRFSEENSDSERVGYGVVVSQEYWSQESMVRLRIGPLDLPTYRRFLRVGPDFAKLQEICRFFSRDEIVFELQLILNKEEVPDTELSGDRPEDAQLGWTTWAKSKPFQEHAEDVVIRL